MGLAAVLKEVGLPEWVWEAISLFGFAVSVLGLAPLVLRAKN